MRKHTLLTSGFFYVLLFLNYLPAFAQVPSNTAVFTGCASDVLHQNDAAAVSGQHTLDSLAYNFFSGSSHSSNSIYAVANIPVVVHIIHNNGPENISDAQVQAAIAHINAKFLSSNGYHIQFCLAQQDPLGNATTGITRDVSPLTTETMEVNDIQLKDINRWPPTCYMNIWVVQEILSISVGSGVVGYATFPSSAGTNSDGIVIEAAFFGNNAVDDAVGAHEIGHYLGLYHTFQNGCTNNNCLADGDQVCDTPPDQTTFASCNPASNSCSTDADDPSSNNPFSTDVPDLGEDYMDYSTFSCYNQFTPGQYSRMQYFLTTSRASLLNCPSCNTPCVNPITAVINTPASGTTIATGTALNFTGTATNSANLQWYIVPSTILSTTTTASYTFTTAGTYWIKFVALTNNPFNCLSGIDSVQIIVTEAVMANCGGSVQFDDLHPAADLPLSNQYYSGVNGGYTWECWFRRNQPFPGTEAHPLIAALDLILFEDQYLGFGWDGGWFNEPNTNLVFRVDGPFSTAPSAPSCSYAPPGGFVIGTWYHAAGVMNYTTQTAKLFVNGQLVDTQPITTAPITDVLAAQLSFDPTWTNDPRPLYGNMDEIRIWDVPKTDAEILANYSTCMNGTEPNLLVYYRCNQSAGSTIIDATANSMDANFSPPLWSTDEPPLTGAACVAACMEICGNGIDDNNNGQIDENCSCPQIDAGNDTIICPGAAVQLNATAGFTNYSWLPASGLDDPAIANPVASPAATTEYTVTAVAPGPNLVVNPDFSGGNFGFTTGHTYSTIYNPCNYYVGPLFFINNYNMPDHTPTSDNMYMSLDGCVNGPTMIWQQTIMAVQTGTNYSFSFWATRADVAEPIFEIHFIGNVTGDVIVNTTPGIPYPGGGLTYWDQYGVASWNSGVNTSVTIRIVNLETAGGGVDFGLDDFSFNKLCTSSDSVTIAVAVNAPLPLNLGPDINLCANGTHTFNAGIHATYHWNDGSSNQTFTAFEPGTYWVTVTDSCGSPQTDTVHIIQAPAPTLQLPNDTNICIGSDVTLSYTSGTTFNQLLWSPAAGLSCTTCAMPVALPAVSTVYYLVASTSEGCTAMDSISVTLGTPPTAISTSMLCDQSGTVILGTVTGGTAPYLYNFNSLGYSATTTYSGLSTGFYPLTIKDHNGCELSTTVYVLANLTSPSSASYTATGIMCETPGTLSVQGVTGGIPPYLYNFNNLGFSSDTLYTGLSAGNYTLTVKDSAGCMLDVPLTIGVDFLAPTSVILFATPFSCDSGGTVHIDNVYGGTDPYLFSINDGSYTSTDYYSGLSAGTYMLGIKDSNNCAYDTTFTITEYFDVEAIYIPNCFTPNADLLNTTWSIKGSCVKSIECRIFNRWGQELAVLRNLDDSWDGTYQGKMAQDGVYMYVADIIYYSEQAERRSGFISLFR